jgi:Flp pilus assembly protein TadG
MRVRKVPMTGRRGHFGKKLGRGERGSALVLVTLFLVVLFGFAALSLDVSNVYRQKQKVHDATDAAALAGVAKLDPSDPAAQSDAITEATVIVNTNGVTAAEIASGAVSNAGAIQVGFWDGTTFTANATPYNAVSVPAQRTVSNTFAKAVGLFSLMKPTVDSIAAIGALVTPAAIPTNAVPTIFPNTNTDMQNFNSGNWGKIDLCGGFGSPPCFASAGTSTDTEPGFSGVCSGFESLTNQIVVLPVVDSYPNGKKTVTIVNFVVVKIVSINNCNGSNFSLTIVFLGEGFGALQQAGLGPTRTLVE